MRFLAVALALVAIVAFFSCSSSRTLSCPGPAPACRHVGPDLEPPCTWAEWGCAPQEPCDGYFGVTAMYVDSAQTFYYSASTGDLVATTWPDDHGGTACGFGPSSFTPPSGCPFPIDSQCNPSDGRVCTKSSECRDGTMCAFPLHGGCSTGICAVAVDPSSCMAATYCGCDQWSVTGCSNQLTASGPTTGDSPMPDGTSFCERDSGLFFGDSGGADAGTDAEAGADADARAD